MCLNQAVIGATINLSEQHPPSTNPLVIDEHYMINNNQAMHGSELKFPVMFCFIVDTCRTLNFKAS